MTAENDPEDAEHEALEHECPGCGKITILRSSMSATW